jgi:hypothetical protein
MRRNTKYSRAEAALHEIRLRDAGNGQRVRMIKIRMDGATGLRWIHYGRWLWEREHGPLPAGKRVCHADGDLLNDAMGNLVALGPGEVFNLYHRLDPEMSKSNHAACGRSAAKRNVEQAVERRAIRLLPASWYAVDFDRRLIHDRPRRNRWVIYRDLGLPQILSKRIRDQNGRARAGDSAAAAWIVKQAITLPSWWRMIRSAALGWAGIPCMNACILAALAQARRPLWTCELLETVREMRELFGWQPHVLTPGVLFSGICAMRSWIESRREGPRMTNYRITPIGLAARLPGPYVISVRGDRLSSRRFSEFERVQYPFQPTKFRRAEIAQAVPA